MQNSEVPCVWYLTGRIVKTYDYVNRVVITLPLLVYEGTWTHSPLSLLCITMILRVRRNFFEITTFPNKNFKVKAAVGSVRPPEPGATFHCRPILEGYARVMVDESMEGFEELVLDYPIGEGETRLGSSLKTPCL